MSRWRSRNGCSARAAPRRASRRRRCRKPRERVVALQRRDDGQAGNASAGRWWSVTTTSRPSARACSTSATAVMPQSTVSTSSKPSSASRVSVSRSGRSPPRTATAGATRRRRAELAQEQDRQRGGADAVGVVVAVDADALRRPRPRRLIVSTASRMSPSANGSWPGQRAVEEACARRPGRRSRAGRAPTRSPRRARARPRARARRRTNKVRAARFRPPSGCRRYGARRTEPPKNLLGTLVQLLLPC